MKSECITCNSCRITVKFGTSVAHDKPIPLDVIVMMSSCQNLSVLLKSTKLRKAVSQ